MAGPHGERFAYRSFGRAGTRTLVLHMRVRVRVRGAIDHWDPTLLDLLAAEREVVVFDNLGTNFSTGEPPSTMEGLVDGALGLEDVDVLGWSMGDIVAQGVALTAPGLVNRLVVAGSSSGGAPDLPPPPARVAQITDKGTRNQRRRGLPLPVHPETQKARAADWHPCGAWTDV